MIGARAAALMLTLACLGNTSSGAHLAERIVVWTPASAASAAASAVVAYSGEGGGPVEVISSGEPPQVADVVMAGGPTLRKLVADHWSDPLFATTFGFGFGKDRHLCTVIAADRSSHKAEAGMFMAYLASRAPGRLTGFFDGEVPC